MRRDALRDTVTTSSHPSHGDVALLLPGMTLNETVFPDLGLPTIVVDFSRLVVGPDGWSPELARQRMAFYADLLGARLSADPRWHTATRRFVLGHSFGGMLALAWLASRPEEPALPVDGLMLVSTTAGPMLGTARVRLGGVAGHDVRIPASSLMPLWNLPVVTRAVASLTGSTTTGAPVDFQQLTNQSDVAVGLAGWRNTDWRARRSFRYAMDGFDVRAHLGALDVPTIVLHGTRDTFFSMDVARGMADRLPRAELRIVAGAAHVLPLTHPGDVLRALRDLRVTQRPAYPPR